jgi:hypothetical protein
VAWAHPDIPLLKDFSTYARFLLAIPVFVTLSSPFLRDYDELKVSVPQSAFLSH